METVDWWMICSLWLDSTMSHSGAQGSIGSHSALGLRNQKVLLQNRFKKSTLYLGRNKGNWPIFIFCSCTCTNMRTSRDAEWICSQSAVTFVRRVSKKSAPSGWRTARKLTPHWIAGQLCRCCIFSSKYWYFLQMGGLRAAEPDWWDVHSGEGGIPTLGHLVQQLQVWPHHVRQASPHGECTSAIMELPAIRVKVERQLENLEMCSEVLSWFRQDV